MITMMFDAQHLHNICTSAHNGGTRALDVELHLPC